MKKYLLISLLALFSPNLYAETNISKDLDGDGKHDRIWFQYNANDDETYMNVKLSKQNKTITGKSPCEEPPHLQDARVGFIISCSAMRSGRSYHYAHHQGKIAVIGYDFWALGNAANDGAGKDSINLKTGAYIAKWRLRDPSSGKLRDYAMKTRLNGIAPINVDDPERAQKWQMISDKIDQEKSRHHLPFN